MSKRNAKSTHKYDFPSEMEGLLTKKYYEERFVRYIKPKLCSEKEIRSHKAHGRSRKFGYRHKPFNKRMKMLPTDELKLMFEKDVIETAIRTDTSPKFDKNYTKEMQEQAMINYDPNRSSTLQDEHKLFMLSTPPKGNGLLSPENSVAETGHSN